MNQPYQWQFAFNHPHMQLSRAQYSALYRIARLNRYSFIPDYMKSGVTRAYDTLGSVDLPIGCFYFVEASYRQCPVDTLAIKQSRKYQPHCEREEDLQRTAYRLGEAYERAIQFARSTRNPGDYDAACEAEKTIDTLVSLNQCMYLYWHFVNGRNNIRRARNQELLNL